MKRHRRCLPKRHKSDSCAHTFHKPLDLLIDYDADYEEESRRSPLEIIIRPIVAAE